MSVFDNRAFDNHEKVLFASDAETGLKAILAVHSTTRGPAVGGCRMWTYQSAEEALTDALRLSHGMSYKNAMADLPIGGGKSVILRPAGEFDRAALFEAFGRAIDALNGAYITAEDVGVTPEDLLHARRASHYVAGLPESEGGSGDPSPVTARGVFLGLKIVADRALGASSLEGVRIAVQGAAGHVGAHLCDHLAKAGAKLIVSDIHEARLDELAARHGAEIVFHDDIYDVEADILAPCALGAVINPRTLDRLKVKAVAGAANNQLSDASMGAALQQRGILFAPDYVLNAGGIINIMGEVSGDFNPAWVEQKLQGLQATLAEIFDRAAAENRPANVVADDIARARLARAREDRQAAA